MKLTNYLKGKTLNWQKNRKFLKKKIEELYIKIENNQKEIFKFTLANTLEIELGVEEGRKRIDSLIDEINRCIEVLSE